MARLRLGDDHLGELPTHEHATALVLGDVLRHHVGLAPTLVLVDDLAARAHAHAQPDGLDEVEFHPRVQPRVHDVPAVPQVQRLIGHQGGRRYTVREPGMVVLHREAVRRGRSPGTYKGRVHSPKLLQAAAPLGEHFTPGQSSLSEREREIAVVVITNRWDSAYPPAAHERRGKEVGLPAATVEAIMAGLPTSFSDAREPVVYEVATTLAGGRLVSPGLYDRAVKALGHEGVTDMIVLMGYYTAVSLTMNFYRSEEHTSE